MYEPQIAHALTKAEGNKNRFINVCMKNPAVRLYIIMKTTENANILLIRNRSQNVGFQRTHRIWRNRIADRGEREILEETGLHVDVCEAFRRLYDYKVKFSVNKRAVYYLAKYTGQRVFPQGRRSAGILGLYRMVKAVDLLTFDADREILEEAEAFLKQN